MCAGGERAGGREGGDEARGGERFLSRKRTKKTSDFKVAAQFVCYFCFVFLSCKNNSKAKSICAKERV